MKLENIIQQNITKPIDSLKDDPELCREMQSRLQILGLLPMTEQARGKRQEATGAIMAPQI